MQQVTEVSSVSTITQKSSQHKSPTRNRGDISPANELFSHVMADDSQQFRDSVNQNRSRNKQISESRRLSGRSKKYSGERKLSKDQAKERILERMKESREGPRAKVSNKDLHKIYH